MSSIFAWLLLGINNNFLGIQILLSGGYDKEYSKCFQVGVVVAVIGNFILIILFGGNGASLAPFISELVLGALLMREVSKLKCAD